MVPSPKVLFLLLSLLINAALLYRIYGLPEFNPAADQTEAVGSLASQHFSRQLGSAAAGNSSAKGHSGVHNAHDALIFLMVMFLSGSAIMHMSFLPSLRGMQLTVVQFVLGMVYALLQEWGLRDVMGKFGTSYEMWMEIDPHLLLFMLLPLLLTGDAMTIDTSVAQSVAKQCMYLAGPDVLVNALVVAVFLTFYLDWSFLLSLTTSAILCATDPVAVVALLKELGASPTLTVQIQGESLLNDGTAIVLYTVAYQTLSGVPFSVNSLVMFLVMTVCMAWGLGLLIGCFFYVWIRLVNKRLEHSASCIQIVLTLSCAYLSYIIAEGLLKISGVLATVASALCLAHCMWPHIVSRETMHHVWHTFETLGNFVIFFLAGALVGRSMLVIDMADYGHLIVIYVVLLVVRGSFIFASRPILRWLHSDGADVPLSSCAIMAWGGLRGAVGLALAIQVSVGRAGQDEDTGEYRLSKSHADRVLFFVGGIACLTTIVNATTCPHLVSYLKITALPGARLKILRMMHQTLLEKMKTKDHSLDVCASLNRIVAETAHQFSHQADSRAVDSQHSSETAGGCQALVEIACEEWKRFEKEREECERFLDDVPTLEFLGPEKFHQLTECLMLTRINVDVQKAINESFLNIVRRQYMNKVSNGTLIPGSEEATVLLTSVQLSLSNPKTPLDDYEYVASCCSPGTRRSLGRKCADTQQLQERGCVCLGRFIQSVAFNVFMAVSIVLNGLYVCVEESSREGGDSGIWLAIETIFTAIFTLELLLKLVWMRLDYFSDAWNMFDAFLVVSGIVGICVSSMVLNESAEVSVTEQARLIRLSKVFRVMRLLRLFRLLRFLQVLQAKIRRQKVSHAMATHMQKMTLLTSFVASHSQAQEAMLRYFGRPGPAAPELAACLLQSLLGILGALELLVTEARASKQAAWRSCCSAGVSEAPTWDMVEDVMESKAAAEELQAVILSALTDGALNAREAESMLHSIHGHIQMCTDMLADTNRGLVHDIPNKLRYGPGHGAHAHGHHWKPSAEDADHTVRVCWNQLAPTSPLEGLPVIPTS